MLFYSVVIEDELLLYSIVTLYYSASIHAMVYLRHSVTYGMQ